MGKSKSVGNSWVREREDFVYIYVAFCYNKCCINVSKCNENICIFTNCSKRCLGGNNMAVSYNKLWKLLIDKGTNKTKLRDAINMSSSTMAKLSKNQPVAIPVLEKICAELECNIEDIMEFNNLDEVKKEYSEKDGE